MFPQLSAMSFAAKLWGFAGTVAAVGLVGWAVHTKIWNDGHAAGKQEAINGIVNQNEEYVREVKKRYAGRSHCLARNAAGMREFEWRQATGKCHRIGERASVD